MPPGVAGRRYEAPITSTSVLGMALDLSGESPDTRYSRSRRLAKAQRQIREEMSAEGRPEGSATQNDGTVNYPSLKGEA